MLTDFNISIAAKLARGKGQKFPDSALVMARVDLVGARCDYLVRTRLAEIEKERFYSLRHLKRRQEWLAGRIAGKEAVFRLVEAGYESGAVPSYRDYQAVAIGTGEGGRPKIFGASEKYNNACISISHSHGLAVAMASARTCGVDIQRVDAALHRIRDYFVSGKETNRINALSDSLYTQREKLALLWSAKEVVKKQVGGSLMPGFLELELVEVGESRGVTVFTLSLPSTGTNRQRFARVAATLYGRHSLAWTLSE